jgi:hypothetical protein
MRVGEAARQDYIVVAESARFSDIIAALRSRGASIALVASNAAQLEPKFITGVIRKEQVAAAVLDAADFFHD